jgi:hypothetical protein
VFDPRVTSKLETMTDDRWGVHGRGMALFSIRQNVESARILLSAENRGTAIEIVSDTGELDERADQSTWPTLERDEDGILRVVKGPHNIVRGVVEFACDHPDIEVHLGTPTEILATLYARAKDTLDSTALAFADDVSRLQIWQRPCAAPDAGALCLAADRLGVPISERTAHRVLSGEISGVTTVLADALDDAGGTEPVRPDIYKDRRGMQIHHSDLEEFKRDLLGAFDILADRYYLTARGEPKVTVGKDEIRVRFKVEKED